MQRRPRKHLRLGLIVLTAASVLVLAAVHLQTAGKHAQLLARPHASSTRTASLPGVILWAWERPEKLDYLDPQKVGVAFLAKTIYLRADQVVSRPRLQPLAVPTGATVIAVARIESARLESERDEAPTLSARQMKAAAAEIAELGSLPNVVMVQVDFDATMSERAFYRELLNELRGKLPLSTALSITALASWCKGDNWLEDLPVDEAVPMLFRMGIERKQFLSGLAAGETFTSRLCRSSAGVSTDEPLAQLPRVERLYVFNPRVWSPDALKKTMEAYER